jgi:hypothetical protein
VRKKHKRLPQLEYLLDKFDYDPTTGGLYKKGAEPCEANALGSWKPCGHKQIWIQGTTYLLHRIVFYMFHRKDPMGYMIDHINGDPADNRIQNLRRVRPKRNARNLNKHGSYVVDADGVGRWIAAEAV